MMVASRTATRSRKEPTLWTLRTTMGKPTATTEAATISMVSPTIRSTQVVRAQLMEALGNVECDNGADDDEDGGIDWPGDGGCDDVLDDAEGCSGIEPTDVLPAVGEPPPLSSFPNDDAACAAVWIPQLADGFVAQGLALVGDGTALVSGYIHPPGDPKKDKSGEHCRVAHVDLTTGQLLDSTSYDDDFERATCAHGGGITIDSDGRVWISDTKRLVLLEGPDIFDDPILLTATLEKGLKGSFLVDGRADHLWIGTWIKKKDGPAGKIYEFTTDYLASAAVDQTKVKRSANTDIRNVPTDTQGAAFKGDALFAASSESTWGSLKTDHGIFVFGPGVEEIEFEGECLWAVFEAGAKIYKKKSFPVIARFDPGLIPNALIRTPNARYGVKTLPS